MTDTLQIVQAAMGSPWIYVAIFVFVAIDGFFPTIPGETLVVTSGVFAASGSPQPIAVIAVAAAAGFAGDHVSYGIGRFAGSRLVDRMRAGSKRHKPFAWAQRALHRRGGSVLVVCRFIPGCRTAATLTTGSVRFPLPSFAGFTAIGGTCWATYFTLVGYLGGMAFRERPVLGVLLGIGIAALVAGGIELLRSRRERSSTDTEAEGATGTEEAPPLTDQ